MSNSYRLRTQVGVDKSLKILLDQDFEFLEILSLKILQSQIYTRPCSDYGVVVGRVTANDGFGIPNAKVSVFVPLTTEDEDNPIIADLYPYKSLSDLNEDGYRYNLLPYIKQHGGHTPTGTFFDRDDVLTDTTLIQVFDKYYRYTARTNESGDYMIFGVPVGAQTLHVDIDLSDIGEFSLSPQDLIRMGVATSAQVAGTNFKSSNNLNELPQIISINRTIEVEPLWGQTDICNIGITRTDFDLTAEANIVITPTAIFMGSIITSNDDQFQKRNCKPKLKQGDLCNLVTGPGEILAIRQTIQQDINGKPILETVDLQEGGQVIDDNGTWLVDVPMNLDYVITNEFGERVFSNDPKKGIPTKGKYRFKVKWNQEPTLNQPIKRGYFLVPNVKEYGWTSYTSDPISSPPYNFTASYAFSLDWNDYGDTGTTLGNQMIQEAIDCEDRFYPMVYNKVYTVSQMIDQYRKGYLPNRTVSIKNILDDTCESDNLKFPTNDAILRFDLLYLLFIIFLFVVSPILYILIVIVHILAWLLKYILGPILAVVVAVVFIIIIIICNVVNALCFGCLNCPTIDDMKKLIEQMLDLYKYFTELPLPNLSYPDCELCDCKSGGSPDPGDVDPGTGINVTTITEQSGISGYLTPYNDSGQYTVPLSVTSFAYPQVIGQLFAGKNIQDGIPSSQSTAPQFLPYDNTTGNYIFTDSLTIAERLNLFNNKSKYFNDTTNNPGGGVNRIKVTFESNVNLPSVKFHYDNVIAISVIPSQLSEFTPGRLVTFQDPTKSNDVNLTGFTSWNQFGTSSMTGTPINTATTITVNFAKPDGTGTSATTYNITQDDDDAFYHKFGMDVEYYQVITGLTYSAFHGLCNTSPSANDSLNKRFLRNNMDWFLVASTDCWISNGSTTPLIYFPDYSNQGIIFLVRGVDPNTSRRQHTYDLSVLFGHSFGHPGLQVTGDYKMNIPIQGNWKSVRHTMTSDTTLIDTTTNEYLYYDSYHFKPESVAANAGFTSFTSNLPTYYSSLDGSSSISTPMGGLGVVSDITSTTYGVRVKSNLFANNGFQQHYDIPLLPLPAPPCFRLSHYNNSTIPDTKGYYSNEIVDGGSLFFQDSVWNTTTIRQDGYVYAPRYSSSLIFNYNNNVTLTNNKIVMRSDRLPTSTVTTDDGPNSFALHGNPKFSIFFVDDDGVSETEPTSSNAPQAGDPLETLEEAPTQLTNVLDTFNCGNMVPLSCYYGGSGTILYQTKPNDCYENNWSANKKEIMNNGCYVLVTSILGTLINGKDFQLLTEWRSRIQITFAACRNVWSHMFTNNWINGTLYAFSFKNDRFFTSPTSTPPNYPYSVYCKDTLYLHPTNNFYYRSSPYDGTDFIGAERPSGVLGTYGGNQRNLKYPTTILDLGPRSFYLQELVMSDDYDGYVVDRLKDTTFTDVSDMLNLLILSRLTNQNFLEALFGGGGANVLSYFDKRSKNFVDGDYAQMLSISSELAIADFESSNYPPILPQPPIYFSDSGSKEVVFGIFFSSDTQLRDFITPKRTIINSTGSTINPCTFNYFKVFSQEVPFYQWRIKENEENPQSIFGAQSNDWYTDPLSSSYFTSKYQALFREAPSSRYFRTNLGVTSNLYKGYIYSQDPAGNLNSDALTQDANPAPFGMYNDRIITVGAPLHFYFGLKKGKTSFDRFARQWIKFNTITD